MWAKPFGDLVMLSFAPRHGTLIRLSARQTEILTVFNDPNYIVQRRWLCRHAARDRRGDPQALMVSPALIDENLDPFRHRGHQFAYVGDHQGGTETDSSYPFSSAVPGPLALNRGNASGSVRVYDSASLLLDRRASHAVWPR